MSDVTPPPGAPRAWPERLGPWIAAATALVALGQGGSTWIAGHWASKSEAAKAVQELQLAELRERSNLAREYLQFILNKDTPAADRATLLAALSGIDGHPLQPWAREQARVIEQRTDRLLAVYRAQSEAALARDDAQGEERRLRVEIDRINAQLDIERNDPARREELRGELVERSEELGRVRARLSIATVRIEETRTSVTRSEQGAPVAPSGGRAEQLTTVTQRVTVDLLASVFPARARANIERGAPFLQAALQEFQVADPRFAAAIIATIAVETPNFEAYEEPESQAARYDGRLGNTQPGDGVRFRGRGYLGLTGRANYALMSQRLGLGTRLLEFPEDAKSPEVAARVLVAWLVDRQDRMMPGLASGDLAPVRRIVSGGTRDLERFKAAYDIILARLQS
jgi:predicted chitinase